MPHTHAHVHRYVDVDRDLLSLSLSLGRQESIKTRAALRERTLRKCPGWRSGSGSYTLRVCRSSHSRTCLLSRGRLFSRVRRCFFPSGVFLEGGRRRRSAEFLSRKIELFFFLLLGVCEVFVGFGWRGGRYTSGRRGFWMYLKSCILFFLTLYIDV